MEALVNGSLPAPERALAEQHIAICEGCRLELELVRAIGSQEKPPAAAKDDWTLDRIFGSEGQQGKGAEAGASSTSGPVTPASGPAAPAQPAAPPPASPPPSMFSAASAPANAPESKPGEAPRSSEADASAGSFGSDDEKEESSFGEKAAAGSSTSWDFEPADSKSDGGPPEESLFFATEALTRRKDPETKKTSSFRVLLWGAGGLVGAILLAFSSWFVLHMSSPESQDSKSGGESQSPADSFPGDPGDPSPDDQPVTPDPTLLPPDDSADAPDQTAQKAPPSQAPRVTASSAAPAPPLSVGTRALSPATTQPPPTGVNPTPIRSTPPPAVRTPPSGAATRAPAGSTSRGTAPPPKPVVVAPRASDTAKPRVTPEPVHRPTPTVAAKTDDDMIPTDDPAQPSKKSLADSRAGTSTDALAPESSGARSTPPDETAPEAAGPSHQRITTPPPSKPPEPEPAPDNSPIGVLHRATAAAEEKGDLGALRHFRSEWRSFMSKIVGPDRARAKREYADCLWAIQVLTGKRSDQKDALAAYHEYLLGAPAGGADSRTVSRLRQLEDALTPNR